MQDLVTGEFGDMPEGMGRKVRERVRVGER